MATGLTVTPIRGDFPSVYINYHGNSRADESEGRSYCVSEDSVALNCRLQINILIIKTIFVSLLGGVIWDTCGVKSVNKYNNCYFKIILLKKT